jgi:hypothetical protein
MELPLEIEYGAHSMDKEYGSSINSVVSSIGIAAFLLFTKVCGLWK